MKAHLMGRLRCRWFAVSRLNFPWFAANCGILLERCWRLISFLPVAASASCWLIYSTQLTQKISRTETRKPEIASGICFFTFNAFSPRTTRSAHLVRRLGEKLEQMFLG